MSSRKTRPRRRDSPVDLHKAAGEIDRGLADPPGLLIRGKAGITGRDLQERGGPFQGPRGKLRFPVHGKPLGEVHAVQEKHVRDVRAHLDARVLPAPPFRARRLKADQRARPRKQEDAARVARGKRGKLLHVQGAGLILEHPPLRKPRGSHALEGLLGVGKTRASDKRNEVLANRLADTCHIIHRTASS